METWMLVAVILALVVFILIRDKGVREKIRKFFSWIAKKIRVARIKSKIQKEKQKRSDLIRKLGEGVLERGIEDPGIAEWMGEIKKSKGEEAAIKKELKRLDSEIGEHRNRLEAYTTEMEAKIRQVEEKKKPVETELRGLERQMHSVDKEIKDKEKARAKAKKGIEHSKREIERSESDIGLSKIEKRNKREEMEKRIEALEKEAAGLDGQIRTILEEQPQYRDKLGKLKPAVARFEEKIKALKEEQDAKTAEAEAGIKNLEENKRALNVKVVGIQKQLTLLFEKVGEYVDRNRIEKERLSDFYSQVDTLDRNIKRMETQIGGQD